MVQSKTTIMITDSEIKKCPLCDGDSILVLRGNEHTKKRSAEIECTNCHVKLIVGAIRNSLDWCAEKVCEKWNKRVQNKVSDISAEEVLEKLKEKVLSAYYAGFNQAHYSHVHPDTFPPKECQSAGEEYIEKEWKWIKPHLKEYASIVNESKWSELAKIKDDPKKWIEMYAEYSEMLLHNDAAEFWREQFKIANDERFPPKKNKNF